MLFAPIDVAARRYCLPKTQPAPSLPAYNAWYSFIPRKEYPYVRCRIFGGPLLIPFSLYPLSFGGVADRCSTPAWSNDFSLIVSLSVSFIPRLRDQGSCSPSGNIADSDATFYPLPFSLYPSAVPWPAQVCRRKRPVAKAPRARRGPTLATVAAS